MLSNKMTVSLMSLITIIAFAFVVTPVIAGEFGVALDDTNDASGADGYQLIHPGAGMKITIKVEFAKAVVLGAESVQVITIDKSGKLLSLQKFPAAAETAANAGRIKSFEPVVEGTATTVKILIAAGVASADPFNTDTSAKLEGTIGLVGADDGPPTVYSITRVGTNLTPKVKYTTHPTVQVRVTLSEMPKKFEKDHISVTEADVTSVAQLVSEEGVSLADFFASDDAPDGAPRTRMMYDEEILPGIPDADDTNDAYTTGDDTTASTLQPLAPGDNSAVRKAKLDARMMHGGIHRAINEAGMLDTAYKYKFIPALAAADTAPNTVGTIDDTTDLDPEAIDAEFGTANADIGLGYLLMNYEGDATTDVQATPGEAGDAVDKPAVPERTDYGDNALYTAARTAYATDFEEYRVYANKKALYEAYTAAMMAEEMKDSDALAEYYAENVSGTARGIVSTGRDAMVYPYLVTITPKYANKNDIVVKIKEFEDLTSPVSERYIPPRLESSYIEGIDKLTIMVAEAKTGPALDPGQEVVIPKEKRIPASGYLVLATNIAGSGIKKPAGSDKDEPKATERTPAQLKYNVVELGLPNLETFLSNGGTIALVAPEGVYISEIMWGSDASLSPNNNSQWIEIANSGATSILTGDKTHKLIFYGPNETPASTGVADTVSTVSWSTIAGMGQSGRTGTGEKAADVVAVVPTLELTSMQRKMNADGTVSDGTMPSGWAASVPPGFNFDSSQVGARVGTPGASPTTVPTVVVEPDEPAPTVPAATASEIMITEIMVDTNSGRLPQWIELTSSATGEVSLDGWEMRIDNAVDAHVLGGGNIITVDLSSVTLDVSEHPGNMGKGQSALVVAWAARDVSSNIRADRVVNVATQLNQTSQYQLLSYKGFKITLSPPQMGGVFAPGDIAGNLHEDWEIPMSEGGRSSIIRREMVAGAATMGTDAAGWTLASSTLLITGQVSFYGSDEDSSTPGQDSGGPLPVELSHFRPARDKETGAAVITWSTQSELNNAGFFIKRSQQRDGEFKVINPTMIPGAGTTSEKQFYTFTDTTAQPNVVYYYQIEDVSLDGNRQLLTRGTRLKGHIGAAGKATVIWGELKTSNE